MKYSNNERSLYGMKNSSRMKSVRIWMVLALIAAAAAGCISKPDVTKNNGTQATPITTPITTTLTPSTGQSGFDSPAPYQLYIKAGQTYQFTYVGNFSVNYVSAYPTQIVKIAFDGHEKTIQKELYENPNGIYWSEGKFHFNLNPVVWEIRDGQRGPVYESTWNTTELYLEVRELK